MTTLRLLLVDDHPVVRTGLRGMFESDPGFVVVGEAADGAAGAEQTAALRPDVVLMDLQMPGTDGVEGIRRIRSLPGGPPVLVLTTYDSDVQILRAIEAGAAGYLLKDAPRETLFEAVRSAASGGSPLAPTVAARLLGRLGPGAPARGGEMLTTRELEVVRLVARGASNREIARDLRISEATVKTHLLKIFGKLGVSDRTSAVTTALERGLIDLPGRE
ncbi:MAG TPA: response regulator transcription factor [Patescibacteria group bacterium]|nr:response regulator transcription factor [Patescibacteria group bacterium]